MCAAKTRTKNTTCFSQAGLNGCARIAVNATTRPINPKKAAFVSIVVMLSRPTRIPDPPTNHGKTFGTRVGATTGVTGGATTDARNPHTIASNNPAKNITVAILFIRERVFMSVIRRRAEDLLLSATDANLGYSMSFFLKSSYLPTQRYVKCACSLMC